MQFKIDDPEDSVMKPLHETDSRLTAGLAIMDAFPLGMLGFMVVKERLADANDNLERSKEHLAENNTQKA